MLGLIAQSPPGTFDVILSDAEYVQQLNAAGYIEKLDPADYPFDDFFPEFQRFPGHWQGDDLYSVITRFGFLGVAYNTDAVTEKEASSYNVYWSEKLKGKVGHFDWHLPNLGQVSLLNGNPSPYDIDEAAWSAVQEKLMTLRPQIGGFFDYGGTFSSLQNGQMLAMAGIGDWITGALEKGGAKVRTAIPEEGGLQFTESFSIGKGSQKADLGQGPGQIGQHGGLSMHHPESEGLGAYGDRNAGGGQAPGHAAQREQCDGHDPQRAHQVPAAAGAAESRGLERLLVRIQGFLTVVGYGRARRPPGFSARSPCVVRADKPRSNGWSQRRCENPSPFMD
jgi:hypothetical protein